MYFIFPFFLYFCSFWKIDSFFSPQKFIPQTDLPSKTVPKSVSTTEKSDGQNGQTANKQYSVLELLELQARARAIRSQLALEPVTKIELDDSDGDMPNKDDEMEKKSVTASTNVPPRNNSKTTEKNSLKVANEEPKVPATRPVRLKRNFRQRQMEGYESDESHSKEQTDKNKKESRIEKEPSPKNVIENEKSPEKITEPVILHDDDVVPIIAEPEILCISSSDSENEEKKSKNKSKRSYITMPVIEKEVRPPTEDELFLQKIKEKSEAKKRAETSMSNDPKSDCPAEVNDAEKAETKKQQEEDEMEDGEIVEEEEILEIPESPEPIATEQKDEEKGENDEPSREKVDDESNTESRNTSMQETDKSDKSPNGSNSSGSASDTGESSSGSDSDDSESKSRSQTSKKSNVDDDDEDIIDLGKDEDLDFEQLEITTKMKDEPNQELSSTRRTRSKAKLTRESPTNLEPKVSFSLKRSKKNAN